MSDQPVTIPHTHRHVIESQHVGQSLEVWVAVPVAGLMPLPDGPRPVLYVLDADLVFGTAVEISRMMSQLYGELPPLLVVGIAYGAEPALQGQLRTRDFTPSADPGFERMAASLPGFEPLLPEGSRMAGTERFLSFVREELKPFVATHYDVAPEASAVFGSSLGGLFAANTLLQAPDTFSRYLIVSPALWWNNAEVLTLAQGATPAPLEEHNVDVYLAVGSREEDPALPMLAPYKMVTNTREFAHGLERADLTSLQVTLDILEDETHTSAVPVSLARGLRALFGAR